MKNYLESQEMIRSEDLIINDITLQGLFFNVLCIPNILHKYLMKHRILPAFLRIVKLSHDIFYCMTGSIKRDFLELEQ